LLDLVKRYLGEPESESGDWAFWKCPTGKHEDRTPSFGVRGDYAYCFACKESWGPVRFLMQFAGMGKEAALMASKQDHYRFVYQKPQGVRLKLPPLPPDYRWQEVVGQAIANAPDVLESPVGAKGRIELASRGIKQETWRRYKVGWNPKWTDLAQELGEQKPVWYAEGLVMPAYHRGQLWSVNVWTGRKKPKYCHIRGGSPGLYGLEQLQAIDTLVLCEGEKDALAVAQLLSDQVDVLGLRGASNGIEAWEEAFLPYKRVIYCMDANEAGDVAASLIREKHPDWEGRRPPEDADDLGNMIKAGIPIVPFLLDGMLI